MSEDPEVRMANDIARQFAHLPEDEAVTAVAGHLRSFWDPRMRKHLADEIALDDTRLDPLVLRAVREGEQAPTRADPPPHDKVRPPAR